MESKKIALIVFAIGLLFYSVVYFIGEEHKRSVERAKWRDKFMNQISSITSEQEKPLMEVEEKPMRRVVAASELELKAKYPGVWAIRRERTGYVTGIIIND